MSGLGIIGTNRGSVGQEIRATMGRDADQIVTQLHGRYYEQAIAANCSWRRRSSPLR